MAHVEIESGFDPTIKTGDFDKTGSIGLMQVTAETARETIAKYPKAKLTLPQTDPTRVCAPGCSIFGSATITCCQDLVSRCRIVTSALPTTRAREMSSTGFPMWPITTNGFQRRIGSPSWTPRRP
jgi:hypothetical protein